VEAKFAPATNTQSALGFRIMRSAPTALLVLCISLIAAGCGPGETETGTNLASKLQITQRFRQLWAKKNPVRKSTLFGISTLQNPMDAWVVQELISEVKPDLIIEAGTFHGGSAILWAMIQREVSPEGRVITIDIEDKREPAAIAHPIAKQRVDFLLGSSTAPEIVAEVQRRAEGKRVLVLLDSLHTADHVYDELKAYAHLVPVGGYVVVQDTVVGPIRGIERFIAEDPRFEPDRSRERFILQNTLKGYLRRVR
jgi:cephalosporin hydroxylase